MTSEPPVASEQTASPPVASLVLAVPASTKVASEPTSPHEQSLADRGWIQLPTANCQKAPTGPN